MKIFPAIDLYEKKAVRLYKGDYSQMTVYSNNPIEIAMDFKKCGSKDIHVVDLEGALNGTTPNFSVISKIVEVGLDVEIGGGIRSYETIRKYVESGVKRVILGTSAVNDEHLLVKAVKDFNNKIAVGVDIKDGFVAIKGWTEKSNVKALDFCKKLQSLGVQTIICTDICKDGAMKGTNHDLYKQLVSCLDLDIIASGGISSINDVLELKKTGVYGAIVGKAYYIKAIDLREAIKVAK